MPRQIKGFVTCDSFIDNAASVVAPLYELSNVGATYAKVKQQYYSSEDALFSLYVFKEVDNNGLNQTEVNNIIRVVKSLVEYTSANRSVEISQLLLTFVVNYNTANSSNPVSDLTVSTMLDTGTLYAPDYLNFTMNGVECSVWLSDTTFRGFFPDYDIDLVFPFSNFPSIVQNGPAMIEALGNFNLVEFSGRIETTKGLNPTTVVKVLNIPYKLPNSSVKRDCHFAFNQYGSQGNFDYVLKLYLYNYLLGLGLTSEYIESIFPSILEINEFFITPRWFKMAIPTQVGQNGIRSQISKAYSDTFDLDKFVRVYTDLDFLERNSYNVPYDYNNILLTVSNGYYTEDDVQDFAVVFKDIVTVTSSHPDFARMSPKTQRFMTLLESMMVICDSDNTTSMFSKMQANHNYNFTLVKRESVWYLSYFFEGHQYYVIPKYEYLSKM